MAIQYISQSLAETGSTTSFSVPYAENVSAPFPPQSGQTQWLALEYRATDPACLEPTITGWTTAKAPGTGDGFRTAVYYRQGDGIGGSAIVTFNVPVIATGIIFLLDGTHTTAPLDGVISTGTGASSQGLHTISSITTSVVNCGLLGIWGGASAGYWEISSQPFLIPPEYNGVVDLTYSFTPGMGTTGIAGDGRWFFSPVGVPISMGFDLAGAAGASGSKTGQSTTISPQAPIEQQAHANVVLISVLPFSGPSKPVITAPVTSETITLGRTYAITWTTSVDPVIAASALTYNLDYTLNDGLSWTQITAATSAGALTYGWNTTGLASSTQVKIRVRAHNGTEYSAYGTTGRFTLATDTTPGAPTNLHGEQPEGTTVTLFNLALPVIIKGTFNDLGDVMSAFDLDWGTNGSSYPNTSTTSSAVYSKTYSGATFSAGLVYFRSRTKDNAATYGPYGTLQLTAGAAPAQPNITSPTAAAPPNRPLPTIAWSSVGQAAYRITIRQGSTVVYAGGFVNSTLTSVPSPYSFRNATEYTLFIDIKGSNGLVSGADFETFVVRFLGPLKPSVDVR